MKTFPKEKILENEAILFARWKTDSESRRHFVLMQNNAFVFVLQGKKVVFQQDATLQIDNKQLLVLRKGVYCMAEFRADEGVFEALVIYFNNNFFKYFTSNTAWQSQAGSEDLLVVDRDKLIDAFVDQYLSYVTENENSRYLQELKIAELAFLLSKKHPSFKHFINSLIKEESDLEKMMNLLYKENFTTIQLAAYSNRSLSSFKREFYKTFQCTPARWIMKRKMADACFSLIHTTKSISDIADATGFESLSHFDKSFRNHFGITPSAFRETNLNRTDK